MENQKEIWKDIPNYEGLYQVSDLGRVKSLGRLDTIGRSVQEKILTGSKNSRGYLSSTLSKEGKYKSKNIHVLVAVSFLNHKPSGFNLVVNHIDLDKTNNNVNNLEIVTNRENCNLKHIKSGSKYVGVCWHKSRNKWVSRIQIKRYGIHLGSFTTELDASNQYQKALINIDKYNGNNSEFRDYLNSL
jgi:hypothetical protein